jgi:DNA helicase HerA-like ATPase
MCVDRAFAARVVEKDEGFARRHRPRSSRNLREVYRLTARGALRHILRGADVKGREMTEIFIGLAANGERQALELSRANRHGLIAGATGTGKTVTLQGLAESFSAEGVPVFVADVKGDLSGIAMAGSSTFKHADKLEERAKELGMSDYAYSDNPAVFWDLYGEQGHPIRTTISEMGPLLLARLLDLNETQEGVLNVVFRFADDQGLLLLDLEDLQAMLAHAAENASELSAKYGNVTKASIGTIQRQLLTLDTQGGAQFFGEPALEIVDFIRTDEQGRGIINVLAADKLMRSPKLYATFLLWLLAELFEVLPEVGDPEKPKLVFFFDEAHLLFDDAPKALQDKIEQVVRLIRSKGVGVYFVTQNPIDIPEEVAGQLGNRVQHALRAFTPRDQRAIKAAAETFRINPDLDVAAAITELRVGEALVSTLMEDGAPSVVQRTLVKPPHSRLGPVTAKERAIIQSVSPFGGKYDTRLDRESAEEMLAQIAADAAATAEEVEEKGREEVGKRERKSTNIWGKALKRAVGAATGSGAAIAASSITGRKSRANPGRTAVSSGLGSIATDLAGPLAGRFVRNLIGGLMR